MSSNSCDRCLWWTNSAQNALQLLNDGKSVCATCAHGKVLRIAAAQFRSRHPKWWIVDGVVVVPIWIVEYARRHLHWGD